MSCDTDEGRVVKISNVVGQSDPPPLRDGKSIRFYPGVSLLESFGMANIISKCDMGTKCG